MEGNKNNLDDAILNIKNGLNNDVQLIARSFSIGKTSPMKAVIFYMNPLANKDMIDHDILSPLMLNVGNEDFSQIKNIESFIYEKYIIVSNSSIENDINMAISSIKCGKTVLIFENSSNYIVVDTVNDDYRSIEEPINEVSLKGPREGFVENLGTNLNILRRRIKDNNLVTEKFTLGRRSQTDLIIAYIDDIVDKNLLQKLKDKINTIDVDSISENSIIEQFIEEHPYSIFPQASGSERPDVIQGALMEGRIAFLLNGTSYVATYPAVFIEFFQTIEDYYGRTISTLLIRTLRLLATIIVIFAPSIYITLIKYNQDLIPAEFVKSLIQSRKGIALTPFMSLLSIKLTIDLLREGGLRLPSKIGQTLSVVGGIIIGNAAIQSKIISATTLLVAGIATIASFVISNYQMSIAIRLLSYPMLVLSNWLGILGIVIGGFFLLAYLCSMENLGVPYLQFHKTDMKDFIFMAPAHKMKTRSQAIPNTNPTRQGNFRGSQK